jgi:hypothetical protein
MKVCQIGKAINKTSMKKNKFKVSQEEIIPSNCIEWCIHVYIDNLTKNQRHWYSVFLNSYQAIPLLHYDYQLPSEKDFPFPN